MLVLSCLVFIVLLRPIDALSKSNPVRVIQHAGILCMLNGVFATLHMIAHAVWLNPSAHAATWLERQISLYKPTAFGIFYYLFSIAVGMVFLLCLRRHSLPPVFSRAFSLAYFLLTIVSLILTRSPASMVLLVASAALIMGTARRKE